MQKNKNQTTNRYERQAKKYVLLFRVSFLDEKLCRECNAITTMFSLLKKAIQEEKQSQVDHLCLNNRFQMPRQNKISVAELSHYRANEKVLFAQDVVVGKRLWCRMDGEFEIQYGNETILRTSEILKVVQKYNSISAPSLDPLF